MKKHLLSLLVALAFSQSSAFAQNVTILGAGDCSHWLRNEALRGTYLLWIGGYLSGVNSVAVGMAPPEKATDADFLKGRPPEQVEALVHRYCQARPSDTLQDAAKAVISQLRSGQ